MMRKFKIIVKTSDGQVLEASKVAGTAKRAFELWKMTRPPRELWSDVKVFRLDGTQVPGKYLEKRK